MIFRKTSTVDFTSFRYSDDENLQQKFARLLKERGGGLSLDKYRLITI